MASRLQRCRATASALELHLVALLSFTSFFSVKPSGAPESHRLIHRDCGQLNPYTVSNPRQTSTASGRSKTEHTHPHPPWQFPALPPELLLIRCMLLAGFRSHFCWTAHAGQNKVPATFSAHPERIISADTDLADHRADRRRKVAAPARHPMLAKPLVGTITSLTRSAMST